MSWFHESQCQKLTLPDHVDLAHLPGFGTTNQDWHMHVDGLSECVYKWSKDAWQRINTSDEQSIRNVRHSWVKISTTHIWASSGLIMPVSSSALQSLTLFLAALCALPAFEFHSLCSSLLNAVKWAFLNSLQAMAQRASRFLLALNSTLNSDFKVSKLSFPHSCHPVACFPGLSLVPSNLLSKRLTGLSLASFEICNFLTFLLQ